MEGDTLIGGLPNELALSILARVPCPLYPRLRCVSRAWNHVLHPASGIVLSIRTELGLLKPWPLVRIRSVASGSSLNWCLLDPCHLRCHPMPPPGSLERKPVVATELSTIVAIACDRIYCFDALRMQWKHGTLPCTRLFCFSYAILDGYLYVVGGRRYSSDIRPQKASRIDVCNPNTSSWEYLPSMHQERMWATGFAWHGCFYVIGGIDLRASPIRLYSGEVWDPRSREWTLVPQLWPADVFGANEQKPAVAVVMGRLYALKECTNEIMYYVDADQIWTSLGCIPSDCKHEHFYKLLGVGSELWVVSYYWYSAATSSDLYEVCKLDVAALSVGVPFITKPLVWKISYLPFEDGLDFVVHV